MTRKWWDAARGYFELFTSEIVLSEVSHGDPEAAAERLRAIAELALVPGVEDATNLAQLLVARGALPLKALVDAAHIAIAAMNSIEYLLTWNCRHLANATLRSRIEQVCRERGFVPPIICTPDELREVQP